MSGGRGGMCLWLQLPKPRFDGYELLLRARMVGVSFKTGDLFLVCVFPNGTLQQISPISRFPDAMSSGMRESAPLLSGDPPSLFTATRARSPVRGKGRRGAPQRHAVHRPRL